MTTTHYQLGTESRIRALVIHSTAGAHPGAYNWLRQGGNPRYPVSCHYYITKAGQIYQFVHDQNIAWHAGVSGWTIDGAKRESLNSCSVGVELENLNNGKDPYPDDQLMAAVELSTYLVKRYNIPSPQLVRHLDIAPGRKTDPAGLNWPAFVARVYGATPSSATGYTEASPLLHAPIIRADLAERVQTMCAASPYANELARPIANVIVPRYVELCTQSGLDVHLVLAQMMHETGYLTSALSQRKDKDGRDLRNPAGIGVWESKDKATKHWRAGTVWDSDTGGYRTCVRFADWQSGSIPAHVGRLVAWCVPLAGRSVVQVNLVKVALGYRPLDIKHHGSVQQIIHLGKAHNRSGAGWAYPGKDYGARIAAIATRLIQAFQ